MSSFKYPKLPRSDIIAYLANAGIPNVSDADLLRPNPHFISKLYAQLLITDFLHEDHGQVDFAAAECLDNPDEHVDSVRVMSLVRKIKQIMSALDCPKKFSLKDLIRPHPERTEIFLSALVNFSIYRYSKKEPLGPIVEEMTLLDEQRKGLEHRISELNEEIAQMNESRESESAVVTEVEAEVKELKQTIGDLNHHQLSKSILIKKIKDKIQEIDEKIGNAQYSLVQVGIENKQLRSKIVQSPDKLQGALEEKKLVRDDAKNAERQAMQSYQEKAAIHEVYTKASKKMSKSLAQMQTIQEQVSSAKAIEKDVKALKVQKSDDEMLDKSLQAKLVERQAKVEQLGELKRQLESRHAKVEAVVSEVDAITTKCISVKASGAAKRKELLQKAEELAKEFYEYSNSIGVLLPETEEAS